MVAFRLKILTFAVLGVHAVYIARSGPILFDWLHTANGGLTLNFGVSDVC